MTYIHDEFIVKRAKRIRVERQRLDEMKKTLEDTGQWESMRDIWISESDVVIMATAKLKSDMGMIEREDQDNTEEEEEVVNDTTMLYSTDFYTEKNTEEPSIQADREYFENILKYLAAEKAKGDNPYPHKFNGDHVDDAEVPLPNKPSPRGRYDGGRDRDHDLPTSLLVSNSRQDCRQEDLRRPFEQFGPLKDIYLTRDYYTGNVLDRAYSPRIQSLVNETTTTALDLKKPKLVILSRNGSSRAILNENHLVKLAKETGFSVEVLRPDKRTEMAKIYRSMNTSDVMIGVHGAAMTHFLFLKPKTVFIQIVLLGTDWAAETYYGEPAKKLGLKYIGYKIMPQESSLYDEYESDDPVIRDPNSLNDKGWEYTKKIYLQGQNVKLDLRRFRETLTRSYDFYVRRRFREEVPRLLVS